ncbi:MAG: FadR family transcriptional regulator [Microbacteriaceae bacterium]|nr:FadR family transcriptional regulator [Microbacteriaceae bacterium]
MTPAATPTRRTEATANAIGEIAERHPVGTRLGTKDTVRRQCGVSVGTFNEALALAQARQYVSLRPGPGGGIFVSDQSAFARLGNALLALDTASPAVPDAIRIRDALDPLLVDDAVAFATPDDVAQMRRCLGEMRAAIDDGDYVRFLYENWALHRAMAMASPSSLLRSMYLAMLEMLERHTTGLESLPETRLPAYIESRYELHARMVAAVEHRDRDLARELMRAHNLSD